jgi:hypothetical protein
VIPLILATLFTKVLVPILAIAYPPHARAVDPHTLVDGAIAAMQRTASLRDLRTVRLKGLQHEYVLGNAERAEGPWRVVYTQFEELRDVSAPAFRRTERSVSPSATFSTERVSILIDSVVAQSAGGRTAAATAGAFEDAIDRVDGSPERALLLASASAALKTDGIAKRFGLTYDVVSFPWRNGRMKIEINRDSHLPDAIEVVREYPDNFRWAPFGVATMRTDFVDWSVQSSGAYYPQQEKVSFNGERLRDISFATVTLGNARPAADSFLVADSVRAQHVKNLANGVLRLRGGARGQPLELAPGVLRVPDQWAMTLVKQSDGVVIFESHISPQYVRDVIDEAHRRWPSSPIKAFVLTSDPWGHLGGLAEAAKTGVPIYASAGSIPFFTSLVKNPRTKWMPVSGKTVIGAGDNAIELYPVGGPYAERMLMAYFPQHRLLYGADLVFYNRGPDGKQTAGFLVTEATDLKRAVEREKLSVAKVYCVQNYGPFTWSEFVAP